MLQLFFVDDINIPQLTGDNAHHANRVLRLTAGEEILISDGAGKWAQCSITSVSKKVIEFSVLHKGFEERDTRNISVLQALPKHDRAKETVELLTASGVSTIYPWQSARSIGKDSDKWNIVAIEASKQSRRFHIPQISTKLDTPNAIRLLSDFDQVLICHESATNKISDVVTGARNTLIIIGPEGGLTAAELKLFENAGGKAIRLGRPIFRSAHAGIAAISAANALMRVW
jgi:16S rRNA (uracil1498-N3)-methyltransferase